MGTEHADKFWYNLRTGLVEFGMLSASVDRVGPFETRSDAEAAPQLLRDRSQAWDEDDRTGN
jgi:hypothetical protein